MNLCRSCDQDFSSVKMFDKHRVGVHEYTFSEGLRMDPPREDGRRCLSVHEMTRRGWALNKHGRWSDPAKNVGAAERLSDYRTRAS